MMGRRSVDGVAREEMLARYVAGETASALGREYGISPQSIRQAANAAGIVVRGHFGQHLTAEQVAEIIRLRREGLSMDQIAARVGKGRTTVANLLRKEGFPPAPPGRGGRGPLSAEMKKQAVARYAEGVSSGLVAVEVGTTPASVLKWARAAGVLIRPKGAWQRRGPTISGVARGRARDAALRRLKALHADEYRTLYAAELAKIAEKTPGGEG